MHVFRIGQYLSGPLMGYLVDLYGPATIVLFSSIFMFLGYGLMSLGVEWKLPFYAFALLYFLSGLGSSAAYNAALNSTVIS